MSSANYKGRVIVKTARGYEVNGLVFKSLEYATDAIDAESV